MINNGGIYLKKIVGCVVICLLCFVQIPVHTDAKFHLSELKTINDFTLKTLDGKDIQLSKLKGKPIVINFFTTWCPTCKEELPNLIKFQKKYGKDIYFLSINYTSYEVGKIDKIKEFVKKWNINFPVLLDSTGKVGKKYEVITIPTTFLIDKEGNVVRRNVGPITFEELEAFILESK